MSKGTPIHPIRLSVDLLNRILRQMKMTEFWSREAQLTLSDWIRRACEEKLAKMARSRRPRRRRPSIRTEAENVLPL